MFLKKGFVNNITLSSVHLIFSKSNVNIFRYLSCTKTKFEQHEKLFFSNISILAVMHTVVTSVKLRTPSNITVIIITFHEIFMHFNDR